MTLPRRPVLALAGAGALTLPAAASAQGPAPAAPKLRIVAERVGGARATVMAGRPWRVRGVLTPYVAGQTATVRFYKDGRRVRVRQVAILPSVTGRAGYFLVSFTSRSPGRVTIRASHAATPELPTLVARPRTVRVRPLRLALGARGPMVRRLQEQLAPLGYVVGRPGIYDDRTARAVLAFRKVTGMPRTAEATSEVFARLARGGGRFRARFPSHGRHVEADLSRQVLALIRGARVERIYPTSSGAPGTPTIVGSFRVYSKTPGYNAKRMYFSSYFIRGYAVHGFDPVPGFPASHGCLRVPIPDAVSIYRWMGIGVRVDVYP